MSELHVYTTDGLSLAEALRAFGQLSGNVPVAAILYSYRDCTLGLLHADGGMSDSSGKKMDDLTPYYEARAFHAGAELRWLNLPDDAAKTRSVVLAAAPQALNWAMVPVPPITGTLEQAYLLWGQGTGRVISEGWSELSMARIGPLPVPVAGVGNKKRTVLRSIEYLAEAADGNAFVLDERLCWMGVSNG